MRQHCATPILLTDEVGKDSGGDDDNTDNNGKFFILFIVLIK
jgi:hypothetical protein